MIWDSIEFIFHEAALNLRRERLSAVATVTIIAVLLLILGANVLFLLDVRLWTERVAQELEVSVFFRQHVSRSEALDAVGRIAAWPEVAAARFIPKEEAWRKQQEKFPAARKLQGIDNPLPDAVLVHAREPELLSKLAKRLCLVEGVDKVVAQDTFIHRVVQVRRIVNWAGIVISALVALAGLFIIHNAIRLALHARWREIYIMQLVGATRRFVAAPFLLEGAAHGAVGAAITCCLLIPARIYLRDLAAKSLPFLPFLPDQMLLPFGVALVLSGAFLGLVGSVISIRRFLQRHPDWHD